MAHEGKYAVSDVQYAVVKTMSELLQGCESLAVYKADAEKAGDHETARIFEKIHESYDGFALELDAALRRIVSHG